jgi:hypothetical protein
MNICQYEIANYVVSFCSIGFLIAFISLTIFVLELTYTQPNPKADAGSRTIIRPSPYESSLLSNQITVTSDRQIYPPYTNVNITITNSGIRPVKFSSSDSDIKIINTATNESFTPGVLLTSSVIPSGSSKVIVWNQLDFNGRQVKAGNYSAVAKVGTLKGKATFMIK